MRILTALAITLFAACGSTKNVVMDYSETTQADWVQPSPMLQQQIEEEAKRLPWTRGFERLELIRWFASIGEPAYPALLQLAEDERDDVAAAALGALGATLDRRLVPHIHELHWSDERNAGDLSLERARSLIRLGDWSEIPTLIAGLRDERVYTRALCLDALREATHETHGFDPRSEAPDRAKSIQAWESWWSERSGDHFLKG